MRLTRLYLAVMCAFGLTACDTNTVEAPPPGFLEGVTDNHQIGLMVNSLGRSIRLFQLGNPSDTRDIPLGTSSAITPVGVSVNGRYAIVPLGNAASVAMLDLAAQNMAKIFTFPSGNSTLR